MSTTVIECVCVRVCIPYCVSVCASMPACMRVSECACATGRTDVSAGAVGGAYPPVCRGPRAHCSVCVCIAGIAQEMSGMV